MKHVRNCVNRCTYSNEFSSPDGKIPGLSELKQPESWSIYGPQIAPALGWIARTWGAVARTCGLGRGISVWRLIGAIIHGLTTSVMNWTNSSPTQLFPD